MTAKRQTSDKPKSNRKAPRTAWKPGQSGNPAGRPKSGESWSDIFKLVGEMYSDDVIQIIGADNDLGRSFRLYPKNVQVKILVAARVMAAIMHEPTPGLLKEVLDRIEGKVADKLQMSGTLEVDGLTEALDAIYGKKQD